MVEVVISDADGIERPEFGRRYHDNAPREMLVDGSPYEFVRFKAPGIAVYRPRPQPQAPPRTSVVQLRRNTTQNRFNQVPGPLVAKIVRVADNTLVGNLDLRTVELSTSFPDLFVAWERLRREGVKHAAESAPVPLSRETLADALAALRQNGFDWRMDRRRRGSRKQGRRAANLKIA